MLRRCPSRSCRSAHRPIIWHVMKYYAHYGQKDFILCLGYKSAVIKEYFLRYNEAMSNDFVMSEGGKNLQLLGTDIQDWTITFADTGLHVEHRTAAEGGRTLSAQAKRSSWPTTRTA